MSDNKIHRCKDLPASVDVIFSWEEWHVSDDHDCGEADRISNIKFCPYCGAKL